MASLIFHLGSAIVLVTRVTKFYSTAHAKERIGQRDLRLDEMKQVVNYHDTKTQQYRGDHGGFVYKFKKTSGSKTLTVVAEIKADQCWLISGWFQNAC